MLTHPGPAERATVHLAAGGGYVLVEATEGADLEPKTTGALQLYDAAGNHVGDWKDESIRSMMFVALTPNGAAVYRSDAAYRFLAMGRPFGDAAITRPMPGLAEPGLVFSAK